MAIGITPNETYPWVAPWERDRSPDRQTVFLLRYLEEAEHTALQDYMSSRGMQQIGTATRLILQAGLAGVERFNDAKGAPIEFATREATVFGRRGRAATEAFLGRLNKRLRAALVDEISNQEITEDEAGN